MTQDTQVTQVPAIPALAEYHVTFGVQYRPGGEQHPHLDHPCPANGYVVIEAPDYETARRLTFAAFDNRFSMIHPAIGHDTSYYPLGEIGRLHWTGTAALIGADQ